MKKVTLFLFVLALLSGYEFNFGMDKAKSECLPHRQGSVDMDTYDTIVPDMKSYNSGPRLLCWQLENQSDPDLVDKYIKVMVLGGFQHRLLNGIFYNTGDLAPVGGTMVINTNGTRRVSLQGTYVDDSENVHVVILDGTMDSKSKNGTIYIRKDEGVTNFYNLTRVPCKTLPEPPAPQDWE